VCYVAVMTLEEQAATLRPPEILALLVQQRELQEQNAALKRQVEWFQRQLFGRKSEKRLREPDPHCSKDHCEEHCTLCL
jgi:hypothetical protein